MTSSRSVRKQHTTRLAEEARARKQKAIELDCQPETLARCSECEQLFPESKAIRHGNLQFCSEECEKKSAKRQRPVPTLAQFIDHRIIPWAKATFETRKPNSWLWYRTEARAIKACNRIANLKLNEITSERISDFAAYRLSLGLQVSTVNSALRVLRRILHLGVEWGEIVAVPKVKRLSGETHRDRVITSAEETRYLAAAPELLSSLAAVLLDTGLRPEECYRLQWEDVTWINGRHGSLRVTHGKTAAARRVLPMTSRVRNILETRWLNAGKPDEGWVWPAPTRSGHIEVSGLRKHHVKTFAAIAAEAKKQNQKPVRPFVLYSLRHTFLTRLGQSGCDAWTLARIAGHNSIAISARYVHPSDDAIMTAFSRLGVVDGSHKNSHSPEMLRSGENSLLPASSVQ